MDHFTRLPDDHVVSILSYVDLEEIVMSVSLVNQRFTRLCQDASLWRESWLDLSVDLHRGIKILERCPQLEKLSLSDHPKDIGRVASYALQHCPRLEELLIYICPNMDELLESIAMFGGSLKKLSLIGDTDGELFEYWDSNVFRLYAGSLRNLTYLDIQCISDLDCIDDAGVREIMNFCSHLEHFCIPWVFGLSDETISHFLDQAQSRIKTFEFEGSAVMNATFTKLGKCHKLEALVINDASKMEKSGFLAISELPNLQKLIVDFPQQLKTPDFRQAFSNNKLTKLFYLSLSNCEGINDQVLMDIVNSCPALRHLEVFCDKVTNAGLKYIVTHCHKLQYLHVTRLENVTMEAFEDIRAPLRKLHVTDCCINLTESEMSAFKDRNPGMQVEGFCGDFGVLRIG